MKDQLHVVGIQTDLFWENPTKNIAAFEEKINSLPENTDLVVLPEMFTTGFTMNPKNIAEKIDGNTISWLQEIAVKKQLAITGSIVIQKKKNIITNLFLCILQAKLKRILKDILLLWRVKIKYILLVQKN